VTLLVGIVLTGSLGLCLYAYVGYPAILKVLSLVGRLSPRGPAPEWANGPRAWPFITITIPVHNEAAVIADTLERILEVEYPVGRRQILVVSDASTDGTDAIVRRFAERGVELLALPERHGKTAAENAARAYLKGEIIVNTDASVRVHPRAVTQLVAAFADPSVGVASGCDVSVANLDDRTNPGEQAYVGYEMWVRELETRVRGIVGASGCLYAIRRDLHMQFMPEVLSRDFGAALVAREHGYRAVTVPAATCWVPRSASLRREYRRKVRTMVRGLGTLWYKRSLLNPGRYGVFSWMLVSHKLCRWLVPWTLVAMAAGLAWLAPRHWWAGAALALGGTAGLVAALGWLWPERTPLPRALALPTYAVTGNVAALFAWVRALGGRGTAVWEPTRRGAVGPGSGLPAAAPAEHHGGRHQHDLEVLER
jgi:cellulose synthase/poly-beta-1,6-N-acetylglucosamine synthase-like glycosyltransferase